MELKIIGKREEPLLSRTRVEAEISFDKTTPSKSEIRDVLAKELGKDEKLIVIRNIYTEYGIRKAKNMSYAYDNEEIMKKIELQPIEKEGAKEAPKAEKPESKGEAKEETKEQKGAAEEKKQ